MSPARKQATGPADRRQQLVDEALAAAQRIEEARAAMALAAEDRQDAILELTASGLTVREAATALGVSHGVIQAAITEARKRRG